LAEHEKGLAYAEAAQQAMARAGDSAGAQLRMKLLSSEGTVHYAKGDYPEVARLFGEAVALGRRTLAPDHPDLATALQNLAAVYYAQGKYAAAVGTGRDALAIREQNDGPDHPDVAMGLGNLAAALAGQGKLGESRATHERALAIRQTSLGAEHPLVASSLSNLGVTLHRLGDYEESARRHRSALQIRKEVFGDEHPKVALSHLNLGSALRQLGDLDGARESLGVALAMRRKTLGEKHPDVALAVHNLAEVERLAHKTTAAIELFEESLAIYASSSLSGDHPRLAYPLTGLGLALLDNKSTGHAVKALERALTIRTKADAAPALRAITRFGLARALWQRGRRSDRRRSLDLARAAQADYREYGQTRGNAPSAAKSVEQWIEQRL
jgi:tetratricopeptide (TPR) repeat protein